MPLARRGSSASLAAAAQGSRSSGGESGGHRKSARKRHLLIIDANLPGIETIAVAKRRGLRVSFIRSGYRKYPETARIQAIVYQADRIVTIKSFSDKEELHRAALLVHQLEPIDAVLCLLEPALEMTADLCARLRLPFSSKASIALARNKAATRRRLQRSGLASIPFYRVTSPSAAARAAAAIGGPVVVKPQSGYDSLLASIAASPREAAAAMRRIRSSIATMPEALKSQLSRGTVVEQWLDGRLVSAELGIANGRFCRFMLTEHRRARLQPCQVIGALMPARLSAVEAESCFAYAEAVAGALGLGPALAHFEMILSGRGPVLIDANARLMGGVLPALYRLGTDCDIQDALLDLHLDAILPRSPPAVRRVVAMRLLLAAEDGRLPRRMDWSWRRDYAAHLAGFEGYRLSPGAIIRNGELLASFLIRHVDADLADRLADEILEHCAACCGIALLQ